MFVRTSCCAVSLAAITSTVAQHFQLSRIRALSLPFDNRFETRAKIFQDGGRGIAAGHAGDRSAGRGAGSSLVETGDRHLVRHLLGNTPVAVMRAAAPHRRI